MGKQRQSLNVEIDADLASKYREAYLSAYGSQSRDRVSLRKFMTAFLEDPLYEEIEFLEREEVATSE